MSTTDSEGFNVEPAPVPAYRLGAYRGETMAEALADAETPAPATLEGKAIGCTCRPSPVREAAKRVGLPWAFAAVECPVHGGR